MANPITWQNVTTPSNADAMYGMELARKGVAEGLNKFGYIIKDQQVVNQGVIDRATFATEQDYLNALDGAKSVDALTALRNSGALDQRFAALGAPSQAKVRGAADARLLGLQQQTTAGNTFANSQATAAEAPVLAAHDALVASNKMDEAAAFRANNPTVRNWAPGIRAEYKDSRIFKENATTDTLKAITNETELKNAITARDAQPAVARLAESTRQGAQSSLDNVALVDRVVGAGLTRFNAENDGVTAKLKAIAVQGKFPVTDSGMPDVDSMTPAQLASFATAKQGVDGPSSSAYVDSIKQEMAKSGATPTAIADAVAKANSLFKNIGQLSTEDQGVLAERTNVVTAKAAEAAKSNVFYTPPNVLAQAKTDVLGKVETLIKDGPMTKTSIREQMTRWMDKGIDIIKDGKKISVPVPPKVLEAAFMGGMESDTYVTNNTKEYMLPIIEEMMTSPKYQYLREEADYLSADGQTRDLKAFAASLRKRAGTESSSDYLTNANNRIEAARLEANKAKAPILEPVPKPASRPASFGAGR